MLFFIILTILNYYLTSQIRINHSEIGFITSSPKFCPNRYFSSFTKIDRVLDTDNRVSLDYSPRSVESLDWPDPLTNLLLLVSYDGSCFNGWNGIALNNDGSEGANSAVNCLLKPLLAIHGFEPSEKTPAGEKSADPLRSRMNFSLIGASRTDKGVHALEMACQYTSHTKPPPLAGDLMCICNSLNRMLPLTIHVNAVLHINDPTFRVRFNNLGKIYTYRFSFDPPTPFNRLYTWQLNADPSITKSELTPCKFDFERANAILSCFVGKHDFSNFRNTYRGNEHDKVIDPICNIEDAELIKDGSNYKIVIRGDRFLYKMVRNIVAHVIHGGLSRVTKEYVEMLLEGGEQTRSIPPAPAHGLELTKIIFPDDVNRVIIESKKLFNSCKIQAD